MNRRIAAALLAALGLGMLVTANAETTAWSCNRFCLTETAQKYLAALAAHDPSRVSLAPDVKFVENLKVTKPGNGLWKTVSEGPTTFAIYVPDAAAEQIGFLALLKEGGKPIELAVRLKVSQGWIVEAEHLIARNLPDSSLANLQAPRPGLLADVPRDQRTRRPEMLQIGLSYYEAVLNGDGSLAPFADDCERRENGMITTGKVLLGAPPGSPKLGCAAQLNTKLFSYIKRIEARRVLIADARVGLVFALSQARVPLKTDHVDVVGYPGVTSVPMKFKPFDLPAAHIFKISGGKIHEIEAVDFTAPYDSKTGWE